MTIEAIEVPSTRSRLWTDEDAAQAFAMLTGGPVYVTDDEGEPVLDDEGNPTPELDDEGQPVERKPQAAKYGVYEPADESKARTQGMALDRLIASNHGRRFGVSVWKNAEGKFVGALLPREPISRKPKVGDTAGEDKPAPATTTRRRRRS